MKNLARCLFMLCILSVNPKNGFTQEWIPYVNHTIITVTEQTQVVYRQPQPVMVYQWIPYIIPQSYVVEKRCLLHKTYHVMNQPTVQWIYQPVVTYR